jgi:carbonic anhydrase
MTQITYDNLALQRLMDGNARYVNGTLQHRHSDPVYRKKLVHGQKPFAAILGCSDSRVPLEMIFDQGLGDIFVIRVAGNVTNEVTLGSVEFAVGVLNVPLVMVMGHTQCGAVTAATIDNNYEGYLHRLINLIRPAVRRAGGLSGDLVENAIRINAQIMAQNLIDKSDLIANAANSQKTKIVPAYYDLATGVVDIL